MYSQQKRQKSPFMSQSSFLNSHLDNHDTKRVCMQCIYLQRELEQQDLLIKQIVSSDKQETITQKLLAENRNLKKQLQECEVNELRFNRRLNDLQTEISLLTKREHEEAISKGQYQQLNMELKEQLLRLENRLLNNNDFKQKGFGDQYLLVQELEMRIESINQEAQNLRQNLDQQQKFVQSVIHMVVSCHPENYFKEPPSLKQSWKWLKQVLQEYVYLKKVSNSQQGTEEKK